MSNLDPEVPHQVPGLDISPYEHKGPDDVTEGALWGDKGRAELMKVLNFINWEIIYNAGKGEKGISNIFFYVQAIMKNGGRIPSKRMYPK